MFFLFEISRLAVLVDLIREVEVIFYVLVSPEFEKILGILIEQDITIHLVHRYLLLLYFFPFETVIIFFICNEARDLIWRLIFPERNEAVTHFVLLCV